MIQFNASLIYTIINLVIFYLLLKKFLFKPVMGIMEKREKMIADGLQNATDTQNEAKQLKADYEKALSGAKEQSSQIVDKAHAEAKKEYNRILSEANEKAGIMLENAKKTIEVERQQTMNTLQSEIAGLAMQAAKKIVDEKTENQGNKGIYDQFLEGVGEAHGNADID
ncbi:MULTISPECIES: F0F1 ATP synthase subunit B [Clostridia]|uniref:F0F1 ATP synthase subunit B n=1 Tax=Clostridia TaxID=186801 RepID=UPI000E498D8B|nr:MULTISPECIES: F0F1 ATP synthase subunit B [Clostridia]RGH38704.1 ATP synthase F0 subunit B [Firmicutes bacterium AM41-5BH]RHV02126.1 ATP synthase F0 subunit B [Firmicutes bacterium OM07-11]RKQ28282.1 ATP synthase F0 subunit B [Ruminococcus sp. B05]TAP35227.1 ATP synthase F0 subunit B [Mediterraneibacter sp. gm002]